MELILISVLTSMIQQYFHRPYYYLKQNDIVYVEPNNIKQDNSKI